MTTFARVPVVPGRVFEVYIGDAMFPVCAEIAATFYEAPDGTVEGYMFDGTTFSPAPLPTNDELLLNIRNMRNGMIMFTDWTQSSDSPLSSDQKTAFAAYRQALRNFPDTCDPKNPVWPDAPVYP